MAVLVFPEETFGVHAAVSRKLAQLAEAGLDGSIPPQLRGVGEDTVCSHCLGLIITFALGLIRGPAAAQRLMAPGEFWINRVAPFTL